MTKKQLINLLTNKSKEDAKKNSKEAENDVDEVEVVVPPKPGKRQRELTDEERIGKRGKQTVLPDATTPENALQLADLMSAVGSVKNRWKGTRSLH